MVSVASLRRISHNPNAMMNRIMHAVLLLIWLELGLVLILVPWSEFWELNYFLYQYPALGFLLKNAYLRGAISGLGFLNVLLAVQAFRRRTTTVVNRT
jgi:hypothetical protein